MAPDRDKVFFLIVGFFDDVHKSLSLIPAPYTKFLYKIRQMTRETDDGSFNLYLLPSFLL